MRTATGVPAANQRAVPGRLLRFALVALLTLVAALAPGLISSPAAASNPGVTSGCAAPESHEELRVGRPERTRARPQLAPAPRLAVEVPSAGARRVGLCSQPHLAMTPVEALPHPLERIPIDRN